jgi:acyl carrier protein
MVLDALRNLLTDRFGCDEEEVTLAASLDDLNLYAHDRDEIAVWFGDLYGVEISTEELAALETVEDIVGYIEDHME